MISASVLYGQTFCPCKTSVALLHVLQIICSKFVTQLMGCAQSTCPLPVPSPDEFGRLAAGGAFGC